MDNTHKSKAGFLNKIQTILAWSRKLWVTKLELWRLCVPHLTRDSFKKKKKMLQNVFWISVTLRWHRNVNNPELGHSKPILKIRPNLSPKNISLKIINLGPHFL
jgi:hypothetical protein